MTNNKLIEIIEWIKSHPLFKWALMCDEIGFDRGNFHRVLNSKSPTMKADFIPKMIKVLKKYGYVDSQSNINLPADYVDTSKISIGIVHPGGKVEKTKLGEGRSIKLKGADNKPAPKTKAVSPYLESRRKLKQ